MTKMVMMDPFECRIAEIVGVDCLTVDDGLRVYAAIYPKLRSGQQVRLEFQGVETSATPFFNAAIGQLVKDFPVAQLQDMLKFSHLPKDRITTLNRVLRRAQIYYSQKTAKDALDQMVAESLKDEDSES
jgi:hypothetical protein